VASVESRNLDQPDESRTPDKTEVNVVSVGGNEVGRFTFQPGWRWSECVKPVAGTESCQARHVGVVHSGRIAVKHEDGTEVEIGPGEAYVIKPVAGTDSCQMTHLGYVVSGQIHVAHDDGTAVDVGPGDAYVIEAGHDAWVVGDEPFVGIEFKSAADYAKG
jgi:uncharacterized cupin superfamily protein